MNSDRDVSVYVRKGVSDLPDSVTFDALIKDDTQINIQSTMLGSATSEQGAIFAIHCVG